MTRRTTKDIPATRDWSADDTLAAVETAARRDPLAFLAVSAAAGFLAARLVAAAGRGVRGDR